MRLNKEIDIMKFITGSINTGAGAYTLLETFKIRESLKLSNIYPNVSGVNWQQYEYLISKFGKTFVDGMISNGVDLGGALGLIGINQIIDSVRDSDMKLVGTIWSSCVVGVIGLFGTILEIHELAANLPTNTCANMGCGDWKDLAIFAAMTAYPFVRKKILGKNYAGIST